MNTKKPKRASGEHKKVIILILIAIVLVSTIAALITGRSKKDSDGSARSQTDEESAQQNGEPIADETVSPEMQVQIEYLISQYRSAFEDADIEALKGLYHTDTVMNADVITAASNIIKKYKNTTCYIKPGRDSNSKVVFIYDDLKIDGIDTLIPNITYVCLLSDDDGGYYIYPGEYDNATSDYVYSSDIQKHINELMKDKEISALYSSVNSKITKAMNEDPDVKAFVDQLMQTKEPAKEATSETQNTKETSETQTEVQTETETSSDETLDTSEKEQ